MEESRFQRQYLIATKEGKRKDTEKIYEPGTGNHAQTMERRIYQNVRIG